MEIALLVVLWVVVVAGIEIFMLAAKRNDKDNDDYDEGEG